MTAPIQAALAARAPLPSEHVVDSGYVDAALLVESRTAYGIDLIGPVHANTSWQAQEYGGFETAHFALDWEHKRATCPQGKTSIQWVPVRDSGGRAVISIGFAPEDCLACPARARCIRAKTGPRKLMVRPQDEHEALQEARRRETTEAFKQVYAKRAGIEGTWSQGVRRAGLRQARYVGKSKTHLQAIATAVAQSASAAGGLAGRPTLRQDAPLTFCSPGSCKLASESKGNLPTLSVTPSRILPQEEHIQRLQAQGFHRKEITSQQLLLVLA